MTRAIRLADVVNFFEYEKVREERRRRVIELKRKRRVQVGPYLSFVFENRETLLFQIQEMCRAERIVDDAKVQEEIDVYSALLPGPGELSATVFIEIADKDQIKPVLDRFMGIDTGRHVWLEIDGGPRVPGTFEAGHSDEEKGKLAAVHFVRFAFSPEAVRAFRTSAVDLVTDHPAARARARLSEETKAELLADLGP
ncbi:MAG TPA: DUF3501 family protein [Candidatus Deferrimicrobiaceae bacterium]|nr:DUF3501 family protein [Candidatus Deferrimicrobiaceae bacterium]